MKLVVALEHRFDRTPNGAIWTQTMFAHPFWERYLEVFDKVSVVARVRDAPAGRDDWVRADGPGVEFAAVPYYVGPWQYVAQARGVRRAAQRAVEPTDAVILRVGSRIATVMEPALRAAGHPYGVEVVSDPYDVFAPGAVDHPLRPFFRWWSPRQLRRQCARASAAAYVTEHALQRRYPPAAAAFATAYSDVELPEHAFVAEARAARRDQGPYTLISVGTLAQLYKAPDLLIDAVGQCVQAGLDLRLVLVGDGKHRGSLEVRAIRAGLGDRVRFLGQLPAGDAVRAELDRSDLFVLPSRQEGLPRAMVEAMARGLPCIGSTIGGIPELLPAADMAPPGDAAALADTIREVVLDPTRMARMSARNLARAQAYQDADLRARRIAFYRHLHDLTEGWRQHA